MAELWRLSASDLAALVKSRKVSAREAAESVLGRLAEANPKINAVVMEMPEEALEAAGQVDAKLARGEDPGPLAGVPITIKVNVDQAGYATTNGLRIQRDLKAKTDSPVVANLRKAGAVIVGRTNTPAFSLRWFTRNGLHGHTRNPWDRSITPGGSSGGASAAVAAGIGAIAHGTDIAGSIRYPAYACGIHGLRPTLGRVPAVNFTGADRHIGGQLMAVSGPLARTVGDLRLALHAMAAEDVRDPWWTPVPLDLGPAPKRAALAVAPDGMSVAPEVEKALRDAAKRLQAAGWEVVETGCPPLRKPAELQLMLWLAEFRRTAAQAVRDEADPDASFVYQQMEGICPEPTLNAMLDALQQRMVLAREWYLFLKEYAVLLCPVSGELPFPDLLDVASPAAFRRVFEAQLPQVGLPFMSLPGLTVSTGLVGSVPVGVMLVAGRYREDLLLAAGEAIERGGVPGNPDRSAVGRRRSHGRPPDRSPHMWIVRLATAMAASLTASVSVGCAWQVRARSSAEPPNSMITAASAIISLAWAAIMCTPRMRSVSASARILMKPSVVLLTLARPLAVMGNLPTLVGDAGGLEVLLGLADGGDLREGVDHVGDHVVVHVAGLAGEDLGHRHALVLGLVRQHRPGDHVADGVDAGHIGLEVRVDDDALPVVERHADGLEAEPLGVGHATDGDQHHVGLHHHAVGAAGRCRLDRDLVAGRGLGDARHLARELEAHALLGEDALQRARHLGVGPRQDAVEELHHQDLAAEPAPHGAELQADHAGADHQQPLGHLRQHQRAGRGDHRALVDDDRGQFRRVRAGGDDDALALDPLLVAVVEGHADLAGAQDGGGAVQRVDLVLLEQEGDTVDVAFDALVLEGQHAREIEPGRHLDAHGGKAVARLLVGSEACSSALEGMQPMLRQVPP